MTQVVFHSKYPALHYLLASKLWPSPRSITFRNAEYITSDAEEIRVLREQCVTEARVGNFALWEMPAGTKASASGPAITQDNPLGGFVPPSLHDHQAVTAQTAAPPTSPPARARTRGRAAKATAAQSSAL